MPDNADKNIFDDAAPQEGRRMLGQLLVDKGSITSANLEIALEIQRSSHLRLGEILVEKGLASEEDVYRAIADQLAVKSFIDRIIEDDIDDGVLGAGEDAANNIRLCKDRLILPLNGGRVVTADPVGAGNFYLKFGPREICMSTPSSILMACESLFVQKHAQIYAQMRRVADDEAEKGFFVDFVDTIIRTAVHMNASDIHFEPSPTSCLIKFRVDGDLVLKSTYDPRVHNAVANRIGVLAYGEPSDDAQFHDASFEYPISPLTKVSVRVSQLPSLHGATFCLRLLKKTSNMTTPDRLGFLPEQVAAIECLSKIPYGMVLFVGPTGSGKTTALYSFAGMLRETRIKILSIEDPIEVELPFVEQTQVNERAGITFASAIRSFLRHDPDVIIVGEIRDEETARIATEAALTGHMVLTTVHANNILHLFARLRKFNIPYVEMTTIAAVVNMRLVKATCVSCSGMGCYACGGTGSAGRLAITEVLEMNKQMRDALFTDDFPRFVEAVETSGYLSIEQAALRQIEAGKTTYGHVSRHIFMNEGNQCALKAGR